MSDKVEEKKDDRVVQNKDGSVKIDSAKDTTASTFIADFERMDLSPLFEKNFMVAVNTEDRNSPPGLCSTLRGPYKFIDMVQQVANMWNKEVHHAMVYVCHTNNKQMTPFLDSGTVEYLEAHADSIIFDHTIGREILGDEFTCVAGIIARSEDDEDEADEE